MPLRLPVVAILYLSVLVPSAAFGDIKILPSVVKLSGPAARQRLVVVETRDGNVVGMPEDVEIVAPDPDVATVVDGVVIPNANGRTTISVKTPLGSSSVEVICEAIDKPHPWSFRNDVQPVLARVGCNSGACHGALAGKGGFRLSLRG